MQSNKQDPVQPKPTNKIITSLKKKKKKGQGKSERADFEGSDHNQKGLFMNSTSRHGLKERYSPWEFGECSRARGTGNALKIKWCIVVQTNISWI